jgi:hypothetical protein
VLEMYKLVLRDVLMTRATFENTVVYLKALVSKHDLDDKDLLALTQIFSYGWFTSTDEGYIKKIGKILENQRWNINYK